MSAGGATATMAPSTTTTTTMTTTEHTAGDITHHHTPPQQHRQPHRQQPAAAAFSAGRQQHPATAAAAAAAAATTTKMPGCVWTNEAVTLLLSLYLREQQLPRPQKQKKKDVWRGICAELWRRGLLCSWQECDKKYRNLKQTFVRNLKQAGRKECRWMFFPLMLEINRHEPFVGDVMLMAAAAATAAAANEESAVGAGAAATSAAVEMMTVQQLQRQLQQQHQDQHQQRQQQELSERMMMVNDDDDDDDEGNDDCDAEHDDDGDDGATTDDHGYQSLAAAPVDGAPYTPAQSPTCSAMNLSQRAYNPLPPPSSSPTPVPPSASIDCYTTTTTTATTTATVVAQPPKKRRRTTHNNHFDFQFAASNAEPTVTHHQAAIKVEPPAPTHVSTSNPVHPVVCKQSGSPLPPPLMQPPLFLNHHDSPAPAPATFGGDRQQLVPLDIRLLQAAMPFVSTHSAAQFGHTHPQLQRHLQQTIEQSMRTTAPAALAAGCVKTVPISPSTMQSDNDEVDDDDDDGDGDDGEVKAAAAGDNIAVNGAGTIGGQLNGDADHDDETRSMPGDRLTNSGSDAANNNHRTVVDCNVAAAGSAGTIEDRGDGSEATTTPPKWFHSFMAEFRRHEQRKLQQIAELCAEVRRTNDIEQQRNHILSEKNDILRHMNAYMVHK